LVVTPLAEYARLPVTGTAALMCDGNNKNRAGFDGIDNAEREAMEHCAAQCASEHGIG
jgi:hypothetical protein